MKCDELLPIHVPAEMCGERTLAEAFDYYDRKPVDEAIDELKQKINEFADCAENACLERDDCQNAIDELQDELRSTKRALWLARAERADDRARIFYFNDLEKMLDIDGFSYDSKKKKSCKKLTARQWRIIWLHVERKCSAKAEEYK